MKTLSYFDHLSKLNGDTPLDVVEWKEPPAMEVEERDLTEAEWARFKKIMAGLE
jgi:hypothetical protein